MTKSILALRFKQCTSDTSMYYFIDEETSELIIVIIYVDDVCFMNSKYFPCLIQLFLSISWLKNTLSSFTSTSIT